MKCQKCDNEATVHEVMIKGGKQVEKHLCEACAKGEGFVVHSKGQVATLLSQFLSAQAGGVAGMPGAEAAKAVACRACGTTYAQFRSSGHLGCPECYAAFEAQLAPLLERAHEGGAQHTGKVPKRLAHAHPASSRPQPAATLPEPRPIPLPAATPRPATDRRAMAASLQIKLQEAIAGERYEDAARLRDQLRALDAEAETPSTPSQPGTAP